MPHESFEIVSEPALVERCLTRLGTGVPWSPREADLLDRIRQAVGRIRTAAEAQASAG